MSCNMRACAQAVTEYMVMEVVDGEVSDYTMRNGDCVHSHNDEMVGPD